MEICGQSQENKHCSIEISRITCTAEYSTKESCGCELIKPVSGFECHLCRVFIRNGKDIMEHISLLQHKTFYQIHLQDHYQDQNGVNHNQTNVNTESRADDLTTNQDHGFVEGFNTARNCFKANLVYDGGHEKETYPDIMDTDNVTKDQCGVSDSDQRPNDPDGICNTLLENEKEGRFEGRQAKIEDGNVDNVNLDQRLSVTERHTGDNYPCDSSKTSFQGEQEGAIKALTIKQEGDDDDDYDNFHEDDHDNEDGITGLFSDDSDCESVSLANKALKIKQEDDDADYNVFHEDDHDDEDGIIQGFLDDSDSESVNLDEHYDGEFMPGYKIDSNFKTESSGQEISDEVSSFATSKSIVEETCTSTTSSSDKQRPASNSENRQKNGINETSKADSCEKMSGKESSPDSETIVSNDINTCDDTQSLEKGKCQKCKSKHDEDLPISHEVYEESLFLNGNIKQHTMIHVGEKSYSRDASGMNFASLSNLKKPETVHAAERPFSCNLCEKSFRCKKYLRRHTRVHIEEKPFSCLLCGKTFKSKAALRRHARENTEEKLFLCNFCGKSFKRVSHLKTHVRVHTGEKPFSCDVCGMQFTTSSNCIKHKMVHTSERPFSCNLCEKSFKQNRSLKRHIMAHTRKGPS